MEQLHECNGSYEHERKAQSWLCLIPGTRDARRGPIQDEAIISKLDDLGLSSSADKFTVLKEQAMKVIESDDIAALREQLKRIWKPNNEYRDAGDDSSEDDFADAETRTFQGP